MQLKSNEIILKVYHRHFFPYIFIFLKGILFGLPLYFLLYVLNNLASAEVFMWAALATILIVASVIAYSSFFYWFDELVITNQRVVFVDWINLFKREEESTELRDIQDIQTTENGIFSRLNVFDFGTIEIRSSSAKIVVIFGQAPDPEGIKKFIDEAQLIYCAPYVAEREHKSLHEVSEQSEQVSK